MDGRSLPSGCLSEAREPLRGIQCQGLAVEESDRDKAPEKGITDRKMSEQSMFGDGSGTADAESAAPRPLSHVFAALNALG